MSRRYYGRFNKLNFAEADAHAMMKIAEAQRFIVEPLIGEKATTQDVKKRIKCAAKALEPGDTFLLTYAGHGSQVPDTNGDESDHKDETWVLFDRELVDDELHGLLAGFGKGVRIAVISDSCHSGTLSRIFTAPPWKRWFGPSWRLLRGDTQERVLARDGEYYSRLQLKPENRFGRSSITNPRALFLGACQDYQLALEADSHGRYTAALLTTWANGAFRGTWQEFQTAVSARLDPNDQLPSWDVTGNPDDKFELSSLPFSF